MLNKKSKRNLSAPFQPPSSSSSSSSVSISISNNNHPNNNNNNNIKESQSSLQSPQKQSQQQSQQLQQQQSSQKQLERKECPLSLLNRPENRIDYLSHKFDPLESENEITFEKYCGPTPESNWVIPGKLLVGAYPASQDDTETFELLTSILRLGVNQFICLQLEYKANVTEPMWRRGQALRPYYEDVKLLVKNKHKFKILSEESNVCEFEDLDFVHFPIKDCSVTDDSGVFQLALDLVESISRGQIQYLHCWGGHGRTGTLVCIMLHLMYGLNAEEAMNYCQKVHDLRQCPVVVGSPQTQTQRDQVSRIISIAQEQVFKQHQKLQKLILQLDHQQHHHQQQQQIKSDTKNIVNDNNNSNNNETIVISSQIPNYDLQFPAISPSDTNHIKKPRSLSNNFSSTGQPQEEHHPLKYRVIETNQQQITNDTFTNNSQSSKSITQISRSNSNSSSKLPGPPLTLVISSNESTKSISSDKTTSHKNLSSQGVSQSSGISENTQLISTPQPPKSTLSPSKSPNTPITPINSKISKNSPTKNHSINNNNNNSQNETQILTPSPSIPQPPKDRNPGSNSTNKGSVKDIRKIYRLPTNSASTPNSNEKKDYETIRTPLTPIMNIIPTQFNSSSTQKINQDSVVTITSTNHIDSPDLENNLRLELNMDDNIFHQSTTPLKEDECRGALVSGALPITTSPISINPSTQKVKKESKIGKFW